MAKKPCETCAKGRSGVMGMKRRTTVPQFGDAGTKLIEYTGALPAIFGPFVTKRVYRFRAGKNPRLVDLRDLASLGRDAGRENLVELDKITGKKKRKPRRVRETPKKQEDASPERAVQEVTDDGTS